MWTKLVLDGKGEKKQYQAQALSKSTKSKRLNYEAEWTIMVGQDLIIQ